ncbi:MAG: hypothetical protein O3A00_11610 [Planctomycetota bacterium]|nr:hypothetical protein [Planctomycetota bacterium]
MTATAAQVDESYGIRTSKAALPKAMKKVVLGATGVAGLVALASVLDLALGIPFQRQILMDVMFLVSAGIVMYMGWDSYKDLT